MICLSSFSKQLSASQNALKLTYIEEGQTEKVHLVRGQFKTTDCSFSHYGIKHKRTGNMDIKIRLAEENGIDIFIDGLGENRCSSGSYIDPMMAVQVRRTISDRYVTKESLAAKPVKHVLEKSQSHISIWFDLAADHLKLNYEGMGADKFPAVEKKLQICQNKIVVESNADYRQTQFHAVYDNKRYVITVTYQKKRKMIELRFNKRKEVARNKKLTQPGVFPMKLQDDELSWKLSLYYEVQEDAFVLFINDVPFLWLPYQAEIEHSGPQNIDKGEIYINDTKVSAGFAQYTPDTVQEWVEEFGLEPTTEIELVGPVRFSSSEVLNSLIDDLGRTIDVNEGLKKLSIEAFHDCENDLQEWPLSQLVLRSPNLEELRIVRTITTPANYTQIMEFVGMAVTNSCCLRTLSIRDNTCSAADGAMLLQVLADHHFN